jgi:hypothetical protein
MVCEYLIKIGGNDSIETPHNDVLKGAQHLAAEYVLSGTCTTYRHYYLSFI